MALMYTPPLQPGATLPEFNLLATNGKRVTHNDFKNKLGVVVFFICNHCPYVKAIEDRLIDLGNQYKDRLGIIAICSNDPTEYKEDSFENLKARAEKKEYPFPYLFDETQSVAHAFGAVCTPDIFVYKKSLQSFHLFYRGRLDDSWKDSKKVVTKDLAHALDLLVDNQPAPQEQIPSMGCSIKWKETL
jgi:peroxiredoxin